MYILAIEEYCRGSTVKTITADLSELVEKSMIHHISTDSKVEQFEVALR